jgi:predicted nucleotidyltransferase
VRYAGGLPLPDPVRERLRAALAGGPPLRLAVLFGSQATGRARDGSDFDIAIWPIDPELPPHDELVLAAALSEAAGAEVDVVRLDVDAPQLGAEIARSGLCLFEEAPGAFAAFRADAIARWIDFEETIAPHRAVFLRKVAARAP